MAETVRVALVAGLVGVIGVATGAVIAGNYQLVAASQSARLEACAKTMNDYAEVRAKAMQSPGEAWQGVAWSMLLHAKSERERVAAERLTLLLSFWDLGSTKKLDEVEKDAEDILGSVRSKVHARFLREQIMDIQTAPSGVRSDKLKRLSAALAIEFVDAFRESE